MEIPRFSNIGCGDAALRVLPYVCGRRRHYAPTHNRECWSPPRVHGIAPIAGDLDDATSFDGLAGIAHDVLYYVPSRTRATRDTRISHLVAALAKGKSLPQHPIYISTSGIYGDCKDELIDETRVLRAHTGCALRRVDAERQLCDWRRRSQQRLHLNRRYPTVHDGIARRRAGA